MRAATKVFVKLESKGRPSFTEVHETDVGACAKLILQWLLRVDMGHKLQITIGRNSAEINDTNAFDSLMGELDEILAEQSTQRRSDQADESKQADDESDELLPPKSFRSLAQIINPETVPTQTSEASGVTASQAICEHASVTRRGSFNICDKCHAIVEGV